MIFLKKYKLPLFFFCFIFLFGNISLAQKKEKALDISGRWEGRITQKEGGYKADYSIVLTLYQKGTKITGQSFVYVDDISATMEIEGKLRAGVLFQYKETKLTDFTKLEHMEWCLKNGQLIFKQEGNKLKLEGYWQGESPDGPCIPGEVFLEKVTPRA